MRLDEIVSLIRTIQFLVMIYGETTRHRVAKNINSVSRSTVYRRVGKLEKMGLVRLKSSNGESQIFVTEKGNNLVTEFRELW